MEKIQAPRLRTVFDSVMDSVCQCGEVGRFEVCVTRDQVRITCLKCHERFSYGRIDGGLWDMDNCKHLVGVLPGKPLNTE